MEHTENYLSSSRSRNYSSLEGTAWLGLVESNGSGSNREARKGTWHTHHTLSCSVNPNSPELPESLKIRRKDQMVLPFQTKFLSNNKTIAIYIMNLKSVNISDTAFILYIHHLWINSIYNGFAAPEKLWLSVSILFKSCLFSESHFCYLGKPSQKNPLNLWPRSYLPSTPPIFDRLRFFFFWGGSVCYYW